MTDKAPEQSFGQPNKMTLDHVLKERDATFCLMLERVKKLEAERDALREALAGLSHLARVHRNAALAAFDMARADEHSVKVGCKTRADMAKIFADAVDERLAALQEKP